MSYMVYFTFYKGHKLPPFYIGSTTETRLKGGYCGSVTSQRYSSIWKKELQTNPHLFKTIPLSTKYSTYSEAQAVEARLQIKLKVVRSPMYINLSIAQKNGCFGRDVSGKNHPLFGRGHTAEGRRNISKNHADCSGQKNGRASWFRFTSPNGDISEVFGQFKQFCKQNNLPTGSAAFLLNGRIFKYGKCAGWKCERITRG